ncbi:MAG: hypothetical protein H6658_18355 [Ardenticatenaceae bacterium]|nr:hypothetical protein [Ardenticatenaceae bacterium]
MRINGVGTTFLGISPMDETGVATATWWFTFLYLPLLPLGRRRVRFLPHKGTGFSYQELERLPLNGREIALTYLTGWLLFPLLMLGPMALSIKEVWLAMGLPLSLQVPYLIAAIIWVVVLVWKLSDWHEARTHPPTHE